MHSPPPLGISGISRARRALILDLDFTLLHLEAVPGAIEVPGRTRSAWIAPATVEALRALQERFALILATARSWDGTRWVSEGLAQRGVFIAAVIMEDGALILTPGTAPEPRPLGTSATSTSPGAPPDARPLEPRRDWPPLRAQLESRRQPWWPVFEWQFDFVACLVARAESGEQAALLLDAWAPLLSEWNQPARELRLFRDGRKVYVAGSKADKWAALQNVLGPRAADSAGVGDGANDVCWLGQIALPCTMPHAAGQVLEAVRARGGFVSAREGHAGIEDVLGFLLGAEVTAG